MATMLHGLWQGALLTALVGLLLNAICSSAARRYVIWWLTLGMVLALPLALALCSRDSALISGGALDKTVIALPFSERSAWECLIGIWAILALFLMVRLIIGGLALRTLKRRAKPAADEVQ